MVSGQYKGDMNVQSMANSILELEDKQQKYGLEFRHAMDGEFIAVGRRASAFRPRKFKFFIRGSLIKVQ